MGKLISTAILSLEERKEITNHVRYQIVDRNLDDNVTEIKKLKIMLDLFEKYGREFDREMLVPCLNWRALKVRLSTNKNRPSSVVLRRTDIKV